MEKFKDPIFNKMEIQEYIVKLSWNNGINPVINQVLKKKVNCNIFVISFKGRPNCHHCGSALRLDKLIDPRKV